MKKHKKKKGFTLIELVVTLAVLSIISLIAIPNFDKIRNDSLIKSDELTKKQIEKIATMELAQGNININNSPMNYNVNSELYVSYNRDNKILFNATNLNYEYKELEEAFKNVKKPQLKNEEDKKRIIGYLIRFYKDNTINVSYLKK